MRRHPDMTGQSVSTFEDVVQVDVPAEQLSQSLAQARVYWQALSLRPGKYRLDLVVKDVNSGNTGVTRSALHVPRYDDETLSASTLMIADQIEKVDRADIGKGQFVIGASKVRPNVSQRFRCNQRLGVYMQVYNLALDATTHRPSAAIEYVVLRDEHPVLRVSETTDQIAGPSQQLTLSKMLPLADLTPGRYKLEVRVTDRVGKQAIAPSAMFTVE